MGQKNINRRNGCNVTSARTEPPHQRKKNTGVTTTCLDEMREMNDCWKRNEFSDEKCSSEISAFVACATASIEHYRLHGKGERRVEHTRNFQRLYKLYAHEPL